MADYAHKETDKRIESLRRKLRKEYRQAAKELTEKLEKYMNSFARLDEEKRQLLRLGKITRKEYNDWRTGKIIVGKRWEAMRDSLASECTKTNRRAAETIKETLPDVYALNHNYATYDVEHLSAVDTSYTLFNREAVERLVEENPKLLPNPEVKVPKDERWNRGAIQSAVLQGILQGEPMPKLAKRMAYVTGMDARAAIRNARTAMTGAQNAGRVDAYKRAEDMGIELEHMWQATIDGRTRHSHAIMSGETVKIGATFSNGCKFPGDPDGRGEEVYNCRCTLIPQVKGFEIDRVETSPWLQQSGLTYEEWIEYHKGDHAAQGGSQRFMRQSGNLSASYKSALENRYNQGTSKAKAAYDKYVPDGGAVVDDNFNGTAHHSNGIIRMNFANDANNPGGAGTTWFHEHGHKVDYEAGWASDKESFRAAIKADVKNCEESRRGTGKNRRTLSEVRNEIGRELIAHGYTSGGVQDIFSSTRKGKYPGCFVSHPPKYWKSRDKSAISREAFANMFEASFDLQKIQLMKRYFPLAWDEFERILGGVV